MKWDGKYRKPTPYIPPYNYCDRWCERCTIDKTKCLVYQTEMDERLHREIDGKGEPTMEEVVQRISKDMKHAVKLLEKQVKEMGLDWDKIKEDAAKAPRAFRREKDPIVEESVLLAKGVAAFLRKHGRAFPQESADLRWHHTMLAPKLSRASSREEEGGDEFELADRILQAQVAHKSLARMAAALEAIRRHRPSLGDEMLDLLALMKRLTVEIEDRWLGLPCAHLAPVQGEAWWGPLRDVSEALRDLRSADPE